MMCRLIVPDLAGIPEREQEGNDRFLFNGFKQRRIIGILYLANNIAPG